MSDKIRTAVVGAGKMGGIHAKVYNSLDNCDFVGVYDPVAESAKKIADDFGCTAFGSVDEMIGKVDLYDVSSSFSMERIKYTTALPLHHL